VSNGTAKEIRTLLRERNAILLAHNYQPPEIQDIADLTGDSLELSIKAAQTEAAIIIFCGVLFMAEIYRITRQDSTNTSHRCGMPYGRYDYARIS